MSGLRPSREPRALLRLVTVALALVPHAARAMRAPAEVAAPAERLREVEDQRGRVELFVRQLDDKQATVLATLDELEHDAENAEGDAARAQQEADGARERLLRATAHDEDVRQERDALAAEVGPRLLLRYRLRGSGYLEALLSAPSIGDYLWQRRMVDQILKKDLALVATLEAAQASAKEAREQVEREQVALATAQSAARARADEASQRRAVQAAVLQVVLKKKRSYARVVSELQAARVRLLQELAKLPPPPEGLGEFGARRGTLPMPVAGTIEVTFGRHVDPKFKTVVEQKGVDIRAAMGTPVHAPSPAIVGFAGWFRGYGNLVVLDHGEGYYTLYAHLASLAVARGDRLEEGDEIGTVGDTGSLKGPYLYFEVRSGTKALDPAQWLEK